MVVGSTTKTKFTNDGAANWKDCNNGTTIWGVGEVLNDSIYALCKSSIYKLSIKDLDLTTSVYEELSSENKLTVYYGTTDLEVTSSDKDIDRCMIYSISGSLITIAEPKNRSCKFNYSSFTPGIYIVAASIEGTRYTQKIVIK
jgi:hypothetical protein